MGKSTISMAIFNSYFDITRDQHVPVPVVPVVPSHSKLLPGSPQAGVVRNLRIDAATHQQLTVAAQRCHVP